MSTTIARVFATRERAEHAIRDLKEAGFKDEQIGLLTKNAHGDTVRSDGTGHEPTTEASQGLAIGAAAGAVGGAALGLGILAGVVPVIGPVLALGALGTVLLNAAGGAALAGIAGALIGWGIPEEDAKFYESEVAAGRFLVTVRVGDDHHEAKRLLIHHSGYDRTTAPTDEYKVLPVHQSKNKH
ncbi:hypothetical protein [Limnoglobus roseus]|uniref:General stress protein 17M-like domain-containing protein n=1 Tax=Limnoglobus roseus TaxID=2598579 RepID=A0A5C1A6Z5_9BACT|nr:hypothetical protein [Limnoglobus roseus]QEL14033.1 hypothetical protein PX52LOC_00895 [Limnoglobus roseus]